VRRYSGANVPRHALPEIESPMISLCICTYNEEKTIVKKLHNITELEYPKEKMEIVIIDDCSTDRTLELVKNFIEKHPNLLWRIISKDRRRGKVDSINLFLSLPIKGSILCITDADALLEKKSLKIIVNDFCNTKVGAVCAMSAVENISKEKPAIGFEVAYRNIYNYLRMAESKLHSTPLSDAGLMVFRRGIVNNFHTKSGSPEPALTFEIIKKGFRSIHNEKAIFHVETISFNGSSSINRMRQKARRGKHIVQIFLENIKLLFNKQYGVFGTLIFPMEFFMHIISPILVILLMVTFPLLSLKPMIFLSLLAISVTLFLNHKTRNLVFSFLTSQIALMYGILSLILGKREVLY